MNDYNIEKYDFEEFEKENLPYTMIPNQVIQKMPAKYMKAGFLWIFLQSLDKKWTINKSHICKHFNISSSTYERWMGWLNAVGLIEYRQQRNSNGSFGKSRLIVLNGTKFNPDNTGSRSIKIGDTVIHRSAILPLNGEPVATVDDEHKNTIDLKRQELKEKTPPTPKGGDCVRVFSFDDFWEIYPVKKAKKKCEQQWNRKKLNSIGLEIVAKLKQQIENDDQWKRGYIPNPTTYINQERWNDEITLSKEHIEAEERKQKAEREKKAEQEQLRLSELRRQEELRKQDEIQNSDKRFKAINQAVHEGMTETAKKHLTSILGSLGSKSKYAQS